MGTEKNLGNYIWIGGLKAVRYFDTAGKDMRRKEREIKERKAIDSVIGSCTVCRLGMVAGEIIPISSLCVSVIRTIGYIFTRHWKIRIWRF